MNGERPENSRTVIDVRDGRLTCGEKTLLRNIELRLGNSGVMAVLGPAGTGKSSLLRALAEVTSDHEQPAQVEGDWRRAASGIALLPQNDRPLTAGANVRIARDVEAALGDDVDIVMLDEPDRRIARSEHADLVARIRARARAGLVLVVTHDQQLARNVADEVIFVCAGRVQSPVPAAEFFSPSAGSLAERFLQQGNCWPAAELPELPPHFHWLLREQLAGMGRPGLMRPVEDDLNAISAHGITLLVTLEEQPFSPALLRPLGINGRHMAVRDMGVPGLGPTARLCGYMQAQIAAGGVVAVHCRAGLGRTGTLLAAYLVWTGETAERAIARVREVQPMAIQTRSQEAFIGMFASENSTGTHRMPESR